MNFDLTLDVLVSTMNRVSPRPLLDDMRINQGCIVVNQIEDDIKVPYAICDTKKSIQFLSFKEKGLSKSRNRAISSSNADICVIADDDMYYVENYRKIIIDSFATYPEADIIAFIVRYDNGKGKHILKEGRIGLLNSLKISSVQIAFKRESIVGRDVYFDEDFGAGAKYYMGEENIFLSDCIRKGLKLYYVPEVIAGLRESESSWFRGHDRYNFNVRGRTFARISPILAIPLIMRFAIVKRAKFQNEVHPMMALLYMLEGFSQELIRKKSAVSNGR